MLRACLPRRSQVRDPVSITRAVTALAGLLSSLLLVMHRRSANAPCSHACSRQLLSSGPLCNLPHQL